MQRPPKAISKQWSAMALGVIIVFVQLGPQTCDAKGIHCWIRCHHPPAIKNANDVPCLLRKTSNPPLKLLDRSLGFFTTYMGKMLGIQGWIDYRLSAQVSGRVVQAAGSTDGFYTIDVSVHSLRVEGDDVALVPENSFIRIEVLPRVRAGAPLPVCPHQKVCISGKLMWDADGFPEIHPQKPQEIGSGGCSDGAS